MYGPRQGLTDLAKEKWPSFKPAIERFDAMMATLVYLNFGELEYVELAYPDDKNKFKEGGEIFPLGIGRFLDEALKVDVPRAFDPLHTWLDRIHHKAKYDEDPAVRKRATSFLNEAVYPVLEKHAEHFPRIFAANERGIPIIQEPQYSQKER